MRWRNRAGGIASVNSRDLWVVGSSERAPSFATRTLVERWNGTHWSIVASPNVGSGGNALSGVAKGPSSNLWAVGSYFDIEAGINRTIVERWSGSAWKIANSPNPGATYDQLRGATSNSAGFWAVGTQASGENGETLIEFHC